MNRTTRTHGAAVVAVVALTLTSLAFVAAPAAAAPVNYNESVNGDLAGQGTLPVLNLDIGANTITGTFESPAVGDPDFDSVAFQVPVGMQLVSGGVVVNDVTGDITDSAWDLYPGNVAGEGTFIERLEATSPGSDALTGVPIPAGTYNLFHISYGNIGASASGTFTMTRNVVPEPATAASLLALGAAAAAAALLRRRRRCAAAGGVDATSERGSR
jgi:hypothetical protein